MLKLNAKLSSLKTIYDFSFSGKRANDTKKQTRTRGETNTRAGQNNGGGGSL